MKTSTKEKKEKAESTVSKNECCKASAADLTDDLSVKQHGKCFCCSEPDSSIEDPHFRVVTPCNGCLNHDICKFVDAVDKHLESLRQASKPEILDYTIACKYYRPESTTASRIPRIAVRDAFFGDKYQPSHTGITIKHIKHAEEES